MDWLIDWLIDYWNLQKQVWWEFTARKNAGISEKFLRGIFTEKFSGKVFRKSFTESFTGKFYEKILRGNGESGLGWDLERLLIRHSSSEGHSFTSFSRFN